MNHINQLIDMEYKQELEKLHAREREDTAFSEARMKELEAQLEVEKNKIAFEQFQQKALRAVLKERLASQMQVKREEAIATLQFTDMISIWNSGGHANSARGSNAMSNTFRTAGAIPETIKIKWWRTVVWYMQRLRIAWIII